MSGRRSLSPPWPPLSEATKTASQKRPRPLARPGSPSWPSHPSRNPAGHDRTHIDVRILKLKSVGGGGGCIERVVAASELEGLEALAVEPCPAWSAVHQRLSRNGQLETHTPTDHRRGSLCLQVECGKKTWKSIVKNNS